MSKWRFWKTIGNKRSYFLWWPISQNQYCRQTTDAAWSHHKCVHNSKNIWYKIMSIRQIIAAFFRKKLQKIASQLMAYFWRYGSKRKRSCRPMLLIFAFCDVNNCLIDECDASVRWIHVAIFRGNSLSRIPRLWNWYQWLLWTSSNPWYQTSTNIL